MPLITVVLVLIAVGVLLWLINRFGSPYIDGTILKILNAFVIIVVIIWLLRILGVWAYLSKGTVYCLR
jgi:hypothetical protein